MIRSIRVFCLITLLSMAGHVRAQIETTPRPAGSTSTQAQPSGPVPLETTPFWETSNSSWYTTGMVFRDLNNDGKVDLLLSNGNDMSQAPNAVFLSQGWQYPQTPNWLSLNQEYSGHCAAGDINDDGYADLVVANFLGSGRFSTRNVANLYLNNQGTLNLSPDWRSADSCYSFSCALGDFDNDGDLDLVLATGEPYNSRFETDRIYYNNDGMFDTLPGWQSAALSAAMDVTVGDVDNDGDLDIAFCYDNLPTAVYYNHAGVIAATPGWQAATTEPANTLTLGDINNDGWLDIVVAENGQLGGRAKFVAYLNDGTGGFSTNPDWESATAGLGSAVALYDYDLDNDLDLAAGRWWDRPRLYENIGGTFTVDPVWQATEDPVVEELVWMDVDGGGVEWFADSFTADGRSLFYTAYAPWYALDSIVADGIRLTDAAFCYDPNYGWVSLAEPPQVSVTVYYRYSFTADLGVADWEGNNSILGNTGATYVSFAASPAVGWAPLTVSFEDATADATAWLYDFGDGATSEEQSPVHTYTDGGLYTVTLAVTLPDGVRTRTARDLITALADTVSFQSDSVYPGQSITLSVRVRNTQALTHLMLPICLYDSPIDLKPDSVRCGERTLGWDNPGFVQYQQLPDRYHMTLELSAPAGETLSPGEGEVLRVYATVNWYSPVGQANSVDTIAGGSYSCEVTSPKLTFTPAVNAGQLATIFLPRGDTNGDQRLTITDLTRLVNYVFLNGARPLAFVAADVDGDGALALTDLTVLINHMFLDGPAPPPY